MNYQYNHYYHTTLPHPGLVELFMTVMTEVIILASLLMSEDALLCQLSPGEIGHPYLFVLDQAFSLAVARQ